MLLGFGRSCACLAVTPLFPVECDYRAGSLDYGTRVALLRLLRKFRTGGKDNENQGKRESVVGSSCAGFGRAVRCNGSSARGSLQHRSSVGGHWRRTGTPNALEQIAASAVNYCGTKAAS